MQQAERTRYLLADYTVEHRDNGWYFGGHFAPAKSYRGPYASVTSVTLMIAKQLRKDVERRDTRRPSTLPSDGQ